MRVGGSTSMSRALRKDEEARARRWRLCPCCGGGEDASVEALIGVGPDGSR